MADCFSFIFFSLPTSKGLLGNNFDAKNVANNEEVAKEIKLGIKSSK